MKDRIYLIIVVLFWACMHSSAQNPNNDLSSASRNYQEEHYLEAADGFTKVAHESGTSAELLYNTANSYVKGGDLGHGRLYYERARKLAPGNKAINNNLDFVANAVNDANIASLGGKNLKVTPDEVTFFEGLDRSVSYNLTSNFWSVYALIAFLLTIASLALYLFSGNLNARKAGFFGSIIFMFFSIAFVIFSFMAARAFENHREGVLTDYKISLLSEPSSDSKPVATPLNQGTKMKILEEDKNSDGSVIWYKVRLNSHFIGWVPASAFEVI